MSRKNKLSIKDNRNKRAGNLSVVPASSAKASLKSQLLDDKNIPVEQVAKMCGRDSYTAKAKTQGLYIAITASIRKFRQENRDSGFDALRTFLLENYPSVFEGLSKYAGNVGKIISADPQWCNAYYNNLSLIELAEQRMSEVLNKEDIDDNLKVSAYDKVWKYELAKRQLDKEQSQENENNRVELNVNISVEDDDE